MAGKVRTKEKCPACHGAFAIEEDRDISCPACHTRPKSFYLYLHFNGNRVRIYSDRDGRSLDSYRRAYRLLESIRLEIEMHTFNPANYICTEVEQFRVRTLMPKWLAYVKGRGRAKSYTEKLDYYASDIYLPRFAQLDIRELNTAKVQDLEFHLRSERVNRRTGGRLTPKTVKNIMDGLREFCIWCHRREVVARVPVFDTIQVPEPMIEIMPLADREKVLASITSKRHRAIFTFLALHPIRPGEACALDVRHFDFEGRCVTIEQALDSDGTLKARKNKKAYVIPLSERWNAVEYMADRLPTAYAFPNQYGGRYNTHILSQAWERLCARAGVPYVSLYPSMRHTTATDYATRGIDERHISLMLGHSTPAMAGKYIKRSVEVLRGVVDNNAPGTPPEQKETKIVYIKQ